MKIDLRQADCLEHLKTMKENSVDALVSDPPAGISFMGKDWDGDKGGREGWVKWMSEVMAECLRVMKPGAHGLVWALPRTSHWTATALEDAGFEIRDVVCHLFGHGFPKSLDISKAIDKAAGAERRVLPDPQAARRNKLPRAMAPGEAPRQARASVTAPSTDSAKLWQGWGTALKPAAEHWILVRKPCSEKTVAANVLKWGTGGLNIDGSRIGTADNLNGGAYSPGERNRSEAAWGGGVVMKGATKEFTQPQGRFPANLILDEEAAAALDEQSGLCGGSPGVRRNGKSQNLAMSGANSGSVTAGYDEPKGGASRFFYCAKISAGERGEGNTHPTVKPQKLMRYLIKLITPPGGLVLDPFMGSGSTGVAAKTEGFSFIGIEKDPAYFTIAKTRTETL